VQRDEADPVAAGRGAGHELVQPAAGRGAAGGDRGAAQLEPQDGQLHEVGFGVGHLVGQVSGGHGLPGPVVITHLPDGHRDQPGPERGGIAQIA
jgi:hypothetical protein